MTLRNFGRIHEEKGRVLEGDMRYTVNTVTFGNYNCENLISLGKFSNIIEHSQLKHFIFMCVLAI